VTTLKGHGDDVNSVAFAPDSMLLATASDDNVCRVWEAGSWKELAVLEGHEDQVHDVTFTSDSKWLLSVGEDGTMKLWRAPTLSAK